MSSLILLNLNNKNLEDDNFELKDFDSKTIEKYKSNSNIYENYIDNSYLNDQNNIIENYSNNSSSCPVMSGDKLIIYDKNSNNHLVNLNDMSFSPKKKHSTTYIINKGEKDKIIRYGDPISLTKIGKKNNWKKPSISCNTDRIYINARSNNSSITNENEYECQKKCSEQEKCEMYLMSSNNTCHLYSNVSNVTEYCSPDSPGPPHRYWGKVKSNSSKKFTFSPDSNHKKGDIVYYNNILTINNLNNKNTSLKDKNINCRLYKNCCPGGSGSNKSIKCGSSDCKGTNGAAPCEKGGWMTKNCPTTCGISSNKMKIKLNKAPGQQCSIKYPTNVTGKDGDYRIKKIKVRCDDYFEMYLDGVTYRGSGWTKTFTFNNPPIKDPKGYVIGFKCTNTGGPGALIAEIEFQNGSIAVTDHSWKGCNKVIDETKFKTNTNNYFRAGEPWKNVNVIGLNQHGKLKWDGRIIKKLDKAFVDNNFSTYANYIWNDKTFSKGTVFIKKQFGILKWNMLCNHRLSDAEALCYIERYPDIKEAAIKEVSTKYRYEYNSSIMTWHEHERNARRKGGHLACVHNKKTNDFLMRKYLHRSPYGDGFFIGAYRISNMSTDRSSRTWRWVDGTPWAYQNFRKNFEPNNNMERILHMWKYPNGSWNDHSDRWLRLPAVYQYKISDGIINMDKIISFAKKHWINFGCRELRSYDCLIPPQTINMYDYQGCYFKDFENRIIPNFRGTVSSLKECHDLAEKNRDVVFGVSDFDKCYSGNDIKSVKKQDISNNCPRLGKDGSYQVYYRRKPFDPLDRKISKKNFSEKFTNLKIDNNALTNHMFKNKVNNNFIIFIIILLICLLLYLCFKHKLK